MITLVIVDCQNDLITGTVSVNNAKTVIEEIKNFIKVHKNEIAKIIFTAQWHPYNHSSFKQFGGTVQHHCIQFTPGACIEPKLLKLVQSYNLKYEISTRGNLAEIDQLGAFEDIEFSQDAVGKRYYFDSIVVADAETDFVLCGIQIWKTAENLLNSKIDFKVFSEGIATLDKNTLSRNLLINGIKEYEQVTKSPSKKIKKNKTSK